MTPSSVPVADASPSIKGLLNYGSVRMPLALLELPLFVLLPSLYSEHFGLELALVGSILFFCRFADALLDPAIGNWIDRQRSRFHYRHWIWLSLPILATGFVALLHPQTTGASLGVWLAASSIVTYLGYSVASIAYQAWGAEIGTDDSQRARVTGIREGAGLIGVLIAATLLTPDKTTALSALFIGLALIAGWLLRFAPDGHTPIRSVQSQPQSGLLSSISLLLPNRPFRWLLLIFVLNGIATAIPATLVLFFVGDILHDADNAPMFLAAYFLAGALGMPLWLMLAPNFGLRKSWFIGMAFSVIAFVWALGLGAGDNTGFLIVCLLTGLALGADLAMPPALLASVIHHHGDSGKREGIYFGVWNFTTKLNLAAAAGLALPLLALAGYQPGTPDSSALVWMYAAVPCALKVLAAIALMLAPLPEQPSANPSLEREL